MVEKEKSALRSMVVFLGQGGNVFNAPIFDECLRAYVTCSDGMREQKFMQTLENGRSSRPLILYASLFVFLYRLSLMRFLQRLQIAAFECVFWP